MTINDRPSTEARLTPLSPLAQAGVDIQKANAALPDAGRRRYVTLSQDFDLRARTLEVEIPESWEEQTKALWSQNQERIREGLKHEFGEAYSAQKEANFVAIGPLSMSVVAHHNALHRQVRSAFVIGSYYPALVGACALGERILNHLMLDLRPFFSHTPQFRTVWKKKSFDKWGDAIDALEAWNVLLPEAVTRFRALGQLRNQSIHFNPETYGRLREDALAAVVDIREIIDQQFSTFAVRPWFIDGSLGACFIRKDAETDPFVRTYFLPNCLFVGPHYIFRDKDGNLAAYDEADYGPGEVTDDEFQTQHRERKPEDLPPETE